MKKSKNQKINFEMPFGFSKSSFKIISQHEAESNFSDLLPINELSKKQWTPAEGIKNLASVAFNFIIKFRSNPSKM